MPITYKELHRRATLRARGYDQSIGSVEIGVKAVNDILKRVKRLIPLFHTQRIGTDLDNYPLPPGAVAFAPLRVYFWNSTTPPPTRHDLGREIPIFEWSQFYDRVNGSDATTETSGEPRMAAVMSPISSVPSNPGLMRLHIWPRPSATENEMHLSTIYQSRMMLTAGVTAASPVPFDDEWEEALIYYAAWKLSDGTDPDAAARNLRGYLYELGLENSAELESQYPKMYPTIKSPYDPRVRAEMNRRG